MTIMKIAAVGAVASLLVAGTAQAASTRAALPISAVASKKLVRSSAPIGKQSKDADGVLIGIAAAGAFGTGIYFLAKKGDSTGG